MRTSRHSTGYASNRQNGLLGARVKSTILI
jgi:hypothetical protein